MTADKNLADLIWSAKTGAEIEHILSRLTYSTTPVGRDNNIGTIRMASDPGLAMIERLTNGIDSLLELAVLLNPGADPRTPQEAAKVFGLPSGGIEEMTDGERRALGENMVISLHESSNKRRPTVRVEDRGMGQHPSRFDKTLLSLHESNKVGKPYTMGTYGQGGSVTFGFSRYTLILSRRHPDLLEEGQDDVVGWTIVYEEQTDPSKNILPRYVWVVQPDGSPFKLPGSLFPDFTHGARITHVEYDVQNLQGPFTTQMWQFLHAALFEPVLPFIVSGDRPSDPKKTDGSPDSRVVIGNADASRQHCKRKRRPRARCLRQPHDRPGTGVRQRHGRLVGTCAARGLEVEERPCRLVRRHQLGGVPDAARSATGCRAPDVD